MALVTHIEEIRNSEENVVLSDIGRRLTFQGDVLFPGRVFLTSPDLRAAVLEIEDYILQNGAPLAPYSQLFEEMIEPLGLDSSNFSKDWPETRKKALRFSKMDEPTSLLMSETVERALGHSISTGLSKFVSLAEETLIPISCWISLPKQQIVDAEKKIEEAIKQLRLWKPKSSIHTK